MCQEGYNTICWYYHTEYTDDVDPFNTGAENQNRFLFGLYLTRWLWGYGNMRIWHLGLLHASHWRIVITNLMIKSQRQVCSQPGSLVIYFTNVGYSMSNI